MSEMRNTGHLNLDRHRNLALDLLGAAAGPLCDYLYIVVGYVRVGFNRKGAEADDSPHGEHNRPAEHQPPALKREVNECPNHLLVPRGFK